MAARCRFYLPVPCSLFCHPGSLFSPSGLQARAWPLAGWKWAIPGDFRGIARAEGRHGARYEPEGMKRELLGVVLLAFIPACGSGDPAAPPADEPIAFEQADAGAPARKAGEPGTWTYVYNTWFAAGTPGHCGDCHGSFARGGFLAGSTKEQFYQGMVKAGLVERLGDPQRSPLAWVSPAGSMPADAVPTPNAQAKADISAWIAAGAKSE
jgi:hypothetical protein